MHARSTLTAAFVAAALMFVTPAAQAARPTGSTAVPSMAPRW